MTSSAININSLQKAVNLFPNLAISKAMNNLTLAMPLRLQDTAVVQQSFLYKKTISDALRPLSKGTS